MTAALLCSLLLSIVVYVMARHAPEYALSPKGNTGNVLYDFLLGHELHPRPLWNVDLKMYTFRTSVITWSCMDIAFLVQKWQDFPDNPPYQLICFVFFQHFMIFDVFLFEEVTVNTVDVQKEAVGFQSLFMFLVFIPFVYTIQARYLATCYVTTMPQYCLIPIMALCLCGYIIYRQSNSMKTAFRMNPNADDMKALDSLPTANGKGLLVAGWWRYVRKPNYLGDLMMAFGWSLFCGFDSALPYFYPLYLVLFLLHREKSDSKVCKARYGADWDRYCRRVPYRIIPYIY